MRHNRWWVHALILGMVCSLAAQAVAKSTSTAELEGVLNLNEASADQLCLLPGIGPAKAASILQHRKKQPFRRTEDLTLIKGIGPATFKKLAVYLRVSGPTTLRVRRTPARP
jgi:competence protein ComEA